jgi:hypothetical protein
MLGVKGTLGLPMNMFKGSPDPKQQQARGQTLPDISSFIYEICMAYTETTVCFCNITATYSGSMNLRNINADFLSRKRF